MPLTRRSFLRRTAGAASLAAGAAGAAWTAASTGCAPADTRRAGAHSAPALPTDVRIVRIEAAVLRGDRGRVVGRNARKGVHGQYATDPVVRLTTDTGQTGWGWSRARRKDAAVQALLGTRLADAFDPAAGTREALLALDFPLWDLAGRVLGRPVYALLGAAGPHPVPVYDGSIYFDDLDPETGKDRGLGPVLDAVAKGLARGHTAFKVKVGRGNKWMEKEAGFARDVAVLEAVRRRIGPDGVLLMDANDGYTPEGARALAHRVRGLNVGWFEEPFPETVADCAAFRAWLRDGGFGTLLADGEGVGPAREPAFTEIVRAGGVDVVQFDLRGWTLTRWRAYVPVLAETKTRSAPHNWGSHLSGFYIAQFARGCGHFARGEVDPMVMPAVVSEGYRVADGHMRVPDTPGFGLDLDADRFAAAVRGGGWVMEG